MKIGERVAIRRKPPNMIFVGWRKIRITRASFVKKIGAFKTSRKTPIIASRVVKISWKSFEIKTLSHRTIKTTRKPFS